MVKLFSKNSDLCDHNSPTLQTDRQTDRRTTCDRNTALCTKVHRAVKTQRCFQWRSHGEGTGGGTRPPTCFKNRFLKWPKSGEKFLKSWCTPSPMPKNQVESVSFPVTKPNLD